MRNLKKHGILLGAGVLGVSALLSGSPVASARPRDDKRDDKQDVREAHRDVNQARRDVRQADTPDERRDAHHELRDARDARSDAREDWRRDHPNNGNAYGHDHDQDDKWRNRDHDRDDYWRNHPRPNNDGRGYYGQGNYGSGYYNQGNYGQGNYGPGYYNQGNYGQGNYGQGYYNAQSFTGTVTDVHSDQSFDIRINGKTYNVYTDSRLPRALSEGDVVRVYGERSGSNDIRNANVRLVNNRY